MKKELNVTSWFQAYLITDNVRRMILNLNQTIAHKDLTFVVARAPISLHL